MDRKYITLFLGILFCAALVCAGCIQEKSPDTQNPDNPEISEELAVFYEINKIPRPSGNTAAMQNYLTSFAEKHNLQYEKDEIGNILIKHPGTSRNSMILQAHQDMMPAVADGCGFDFNTDPIETYIKDGWIYAKNTSLGADDGSGVAIVLTALTCPELKDCTFCGLFTVDEETTLIGAESVNPDWLNVDALVNIDNEYGGEAVISSAGGTVLNTEFTPVCEITPENTTWYRLKISGLLSGHSGLDIDKGRQNAILLAADYLSCLENVRIAEMNGGTADSAIPANAEALFTTTSDAKRAAETWLASHRVETDPGLDISVVKADRPQKAYSAEFTKKLLNTLVRVPDGMIEKDSYGPTLSSNLGVLTADDKSLKIVNLIRSGSNEKRDATVQKTADIFIQAGAKSEPDLSFPGWAVDGETKLMQITDNAFRKITGKPVKFISVHGGLECGYFAEINPDLMIVSIGPTVENPHTINERMNLDTFAETKTVTFEMVKSFCTGT